MTDGNGAASGSQRVQEVRLALVLNGGISLAVWMGGVVHELDLLRRASRGDDAVSVSKEDRPVFNLWKGLTSDVGKRVLIDVIAGTSAGGLNGMLLATAIGRGAALPSLRPTWRKVAALNRLLASPARSSLMDGKKIEEALIDVIGEMSSSIEDAEPVTLLLTATALDGQPQRFVDGYNGSFEIRDHRRTYRFKHDSSYKAYAKSNDGAWEVITSPLRDFFAEDRTGPPPALIHAACATASFPTAFPPVDEDLIKRFRVDKVSLPSGCVMDGGVLNNEPISEVLDAISDRQVDQGAERVLVYVVPSPGRLKEEISNVPCGEIGPTVAALNALNYPRESNMRASMKDLDDRLKRSTRNRQREIFRKMREDSSRAGNRVLQACALISDYRERRAAAGVWDARQRMASAEAVQSLTGFPAVAVDQILEKPRLWCPQNAEAISQPDLDEWPWGLIPTERVIRILQQDLQERLEGHDGGTGPDHGNDPHLKSSNMGHQRIHETVLSVQRESEHKSLREAMATVTDCLRSILAIMEAVWSNLAQEQNAARDSDVWVADRIDEVFKELDVPQKLGKEVREAAGAYLAVIRLVADNTWKSERDVISYCLAVEVLSYAFAPPYEAVESLTPNFKFLRLGPDRLGPLFDKDRYRDMCDGRKLYGLRFAHFGSFFNKSWRDSDYAWGRLDAAHHILRILLPNEAREERERQLHEAILASECGQDGVGRMECNLENLQGSTDWELLKGILKTRGGKETLAKGWQSVLEMLGPVEPEADQVADVKPAQRIAPYAHAVLGEETSKLPWKYRLLRKITPELRDQLFTYPEPHKLEEAIQKDVKSLRGKIVTTVSVAVCSLLALLAVSITLGVLLSISP